MAEVLATRVRVGLLLGTAYLFLLNIPDHNRVAVRKQQEYQMDATNPVPSSEVPSSETGLADCGTKDGSSAADNDQPYRFGLRPVAKAPFPFTERQYARLLILRGRVQDGMPINEQVSA
jgi:hypothetical protein